MTTIHIPEVNALFLHVPKAAGSSVTAALWEAFPQCRRLPIRGMSRPHGVTQNICRRIDPGIVATSFSFCFLRNPWDWAVSGWKYVTQGRDAAYGDSPPDFATFMTSDWRRGLVRNPYPKKFANAEMFVAYHTKVTQERHLRLGWIRPRLAPIAFHARFERLKQDWARICERLGRDIPLPHDNKSARTHYTDYYDDRLRTLVADRDAPLIARFGYRFGG